MSSYKTFTVKVPTFSRAKKEAVSTDEDGSGEGQNNGSETEPPNSEEIDENKEGNNDNEEQADDKQSKLQAKKKASKKEAKNGTTDKKEAGKKEVEEKDIKKNAPTDGDANPGANVPLSPPPKAKLTKLRLPKIKSSPAKPQKPQNIDPESSAAAGDGEVKVGQVAEDTEVDIVHASQAKAPKKMLVNFQVPVMSRLKGSTWLDPVAGDGEDRSHVPVQPLWIHALRIAEILVALIVLVLTAYAAAKLGAQVGLVLIEVDSRSDLAVYIYRADGFALSWFSFIWTLVYFMWLHVSIWRYPSYYNLYVHLGFETLSNIFWLATFATLAGEATSIRYVGPENYSQLSVSYQNALKCVKAAAGVAAAAWVLFDVSLTVLAVGIIKQRHHKTADPEAGEADATKDASKEDSALAAPTGSCLTQ